jgi:hypothetical protein
MNVNDLGALEVPTEERERIGNAASDRDVAREYDYVCERGVERPDEALPRVAMKLEVQVAE